MSSMSQKALNQGKKNNRPDKSVQLRKKTELQHTECVINAYMQTAAPQLSLCIWAVLSGYSKWTSDVCTTTTQRVPNVHRRLYNDYPTCFKPMALGTRWVVVVQTSLVHWVCRLHAPGMVVVVVLLFYVHVKHLRSCRDGQLTWPHFSWAGLDLLSG